jgi:Mpv17 / PMP22 family
MLRELFVTCFFLWSAANALAPIHIDHATIATLQHSGMAVAGKLSAAYTHALMQHPMATKMMTGGILATTGDAMAQKSSQTKNQSGGGGDDVNEPYDKKRAAGFMAFDMAYRAVQHKAFPIIVATCHGQYIGEALSALHLSSSSLAATQQHAAAAMEQTLASQLGIVPFIYYPVFFALTGFVQGLSVNGSVERAKQNFFPLMQRNLIFWIPVQFIQFAFIDEQLQIPFLSAAGLCWTFILSVTAGSTRSYNNDNQAAVRIQQEDHQVAAVQDDVGAKVYTMSSEQAVIHVSTNY